MPNRVPEESVTCVAVKEDRNQNIMSSVTLKEGVEEPWAVERVAKFIDLLGNREITLKSDTEPATDCVQKSCSCIVQSRSHHRGCSERRQRVEWAH